MYSKATLNIDNTNITARKKIITENFIGST